MIKPAKVVEHFSGALDSQKIHIRFSDKNQVFEAFDEDGNLIAESVDSDRLSKHVWIKGAGEVKIHAHPTAHNLNSMRTKE